MFKPALPKHYEVLDLRNEKQTLTLIKSYSAN
jgi:hypothetical protein